MPKVYRLFCHVPFCCLLALVSAPAAQEATGVLYPRMPRARIISVTGKHYPGISRALSIGGFDVREVSSYPSLPHEDPPLLIIPEMEGQRLDAGLIGAILRDVAGGTPLLLDGSTPLAAELGIKATGASSEITRYHWDRYAQDPVQLPGRLTYPRFQSNSALSVLAFDPRHNAPLLVSGSYGLGRFIYSGLPLEPQTGMVFQYLPFLLQAIVDELRVISTLAADNLCVYVDFGGEPKGDPTAVAKQLKQWSVREVHLGAFYDEDSFTEFIPRFIAAAHREGIAVYAWLEYPMVSEEFWDQHPQWREETANGHPAVMDWRLHMALEEPACFEAVAERTRRLLLDYDWDGVDFAELYFEAEPGIFEKPGDFTPMHRSFRQSFQKRYGVDPMTMFNSESPNYGTRNPELRSDLKEYRVELITQLTGKFLEVLKSCQVEKPYLQTTLTFIDALRDPTVTERFGVDPDRLLALQEQFGFAVEIEDPYTVWNSSPDRYRAIAEYYRPRMRPGTPFSLDVNVVDRIPPGRPLNKPRGLELYELVANVAAHVDMITLYAFSTFSPDDMRLVPLVLGAQQIDEGTGEDGKVTARRQLGWQTNTRGRSVYLDGRDWPCYSDSQVLIPAGAHRVSTQPQAASDAQPALRIENVNGIILGSELSGRGVTLTYESRGRCYVTVSRPPAKVLCDGKPELVRIIPDDRGACLVLPQGRHQVEIQ
ncbi:MAG TPA: hypothetical protein VMO17_21960 [Terriglobia bacterium]|nr:hypothetical protein [Terriglobia bacterium]